MAKNKKEFIPVIEFRNPKDLIPYKLNAKTHPESQIKRQP
jgi:hypothetical protein